MSDQNNKEDCGISMLETAPIGKKNLKSIFSALLKRIESLEKENTELKSEVQTLSEYVEQIRESRKHASQLIKEELSHILDENEE